LGDDAGMQTLRALGARSVPIGSRGKDFVYAQVIKDVVDFLGLSDDTMPELSPSALAERYQDILGHAIGLVGQMPDDCLERELPNRPRSWRVLMHHIFQIPTAFMDLEIDGTPFAYDALVAPPPDDMRTSADVAAFGESVKARFESWWQSQRESDFTRPTEVYFGTTTRHELLERTVWHSTQHTRQVTALLEEAGVTPESPLTPAHIQGLPLTEKVWD
jgi:uncharacterized damage-inducible protein DinB